MPDVIARAKAALEQVASWPAPWRFDEAQDNLLVDADGKVIPPGWHTTEFITSASTLVPELVALADKLIAERRTFTGTLGYGDGITEPAATLAEMVDPIKTAFMEAQDHDECPRICEECGENLAATRCPECHGSGAHGPMSMESAAYVECPHCAGVGWVHDGCAGKTYADLVALAEAQTQQLAAIRALCADPFDVLEIEDDECECHDTPVVRTADILAILDGGEH